jgi:hypothetical protein
MFPLPGDDISGALLFCLFPQDLLVDQDPLGKDREAAHDEHVFGPVDNPFSFPPSRFLIQRGRRLENLYHADPSQFFIPSGWLVFTYESRVFDFLLMCGLPVISNEGWTINVTHSWKPRHNHLSLPP